MGVPRCYLVCANTRCGSTLLSRALSDTDIAGRPDEYFLTGPPEAFPPGETHWEDGPLARRHGVAEREQFLRLVYQVGSTPNGVFGAKIMWNYVGWAMENFQGAASILSNDHRADLRGRVPWTERCASGSS